MAIIDTELRILTGIMLDLIAVQTRMSTSDANGVAVGFGWAAQAAQLNGVINALKAFLRANL